MYNLINTVHVQREVNGNTRKTGKLHRDKLIICIYTNIKLCDAATKFDTIRNNSYVYENRKKNEFTEKIGRYTQYNVLIAFFRRTFERKNDTIVLSHVIRKLFNNITYRFVDKRKN